MSVRLVIAVDGPASSGKSSVGAAVAEAVGYRFCDTGLVYRALTWLALREGTPFHDPAAVVRLVPRVSLAADAGGRLERVLVDDVDVTDEVRTPAVDARVSEIARLGEVRAALLPVQRALVGDGGIVLAGRDIGTVVLPDADLKIYLDASPEERARRRALERGLDPDGTEAAVILASLRRRDATDSGRAVAPLRVATDAVVVTTDGATFADTVARVVAVVRAAERGRTRATAGSTVADPQGTS